MSSAGNPYVNLMSGAGGASALPYDLQMLQLQRQQRMADLLQQQAQQPIEVQSGGGAQAPISWGSVLAKVLQGVGANMRENRANSQMQQSGQQDSAAAQALIKQLQPQAVAQATTPAIAPQSTQINAPTLPGQSPAQAGAPAPIQTGAIPQGAPQQAMQTPDTNAQLAALLGARGGPQTQMIQQAMIPQLLGRETKLEDRAYESAQAQVRPATVQEKVAIGLDPRTPALVDVHGNIKPITDPNQISAYQQAEIAAQNKQLGISAAQAAESARHNRVQETISQNPFGTGLSIPGANGKTGDDFLTNLPPGLAAQVKAVGTYRQPAPAGRTSPTGIKFMTLVNQAYPDYDASQYGAKVKARNDFTTGKNGNTVRSLNVAVQHLDQLGQLSSALGNGNVQAVNNIAQSIAQQTGSAAPTNFDATKQLVADEIVKAVVGSGGGVNDREEAARTISRANSPQQLAGVIQQYQGLLGGQLRGLRDQYKKSTGLDDFEEFLDPLTQQKLENHGPGAPMSQGNRTVVRTGTLNGRKVVQYSDGTTDYAP